MKAEGRERRYQRQLARGCELIKERMLSIRKAAEAVKIPLRTVWRELRSKRNKLPLGAPTALTMEEEAAFVSIINDYAERRRLCARVDIVDIVELIVSRTRPKRRGKVPFRGGPSGLDYIANFLKRHRASIRLSKVTHQE